MNGGYVIVDFTGVDMSRSTPQTVAGITARVAECVTLGKPIIISGVVNGSGNSVAPFPVLARPNTGTYAGTYNLLAGIYTFYVSTENTVSIIDNTANLAHSKVETETKKGGK